MPTGKNHLAALENDLSLLSSRGHCVTQWAEPVLRDYYRFNTSTESADGLRLQKLHDWVLIPLTLWPLEMCDLLRDALAEIKKNGKLGEAHRLVIDLLPDPPDESACEVVTRHEHQVQSGAYENLLGNGAKYSQMEADLKANPDFLAHWSRIKSSFNVEQFTERSGVIRRTMGTERNLRPEWPNRLPGALGEFQPVFDAFCMRWNLYGMQRDEPLLLKLAVNLTPFATMIVIPAYWSFDPKRDIRWNEIARLHRARAKHRQGAALKEGREQRRKLALKLKKLDAEVARLRLRGEERHAFICEGLGWVPGTSAKRLSRLRAEFKK